MEGYLPNFKLYKTVSHDFHLCYLIRPINNNDNFPFFKLNKKSNYFAMRKHSDRRWPTPPKLSIIFMQLGF